MVKIKSESLQLVVKLDGSFATSTFIAYSPACFIILSFALFQYLQPDRLHSYLWESPGSMEWRGQRLC